jgi:hypothetical protein
LIGELIDDRPHGADQQARAERQHLQLLMRMTTERRASSG